jgi:CBS domain-containing membrane protein
MIVASPSEPETLLMRLRALFWPAPMAVNLAERLRMVAGALLGIGVTAWLSHQLGAPAPLTWIVAPMGASAVLVFCLPASPLAQPWAVVAGNTVSALVGIACVNLIPSTDVAAAVAVAAAIAAMLALRCLHPPGGASALLTVMSGVADPGAALFPVLINSLLLASMGWAFHRATGHRYPHRVTPPQPGQVTEEDLDVVLGRYNQILDVSRDELRELIDRTQRLAHQRRLADTRCADVMTREVSTVEYGTPLQEAWSLLRKRGLKSLPVVDRGRHVVGIVTLTDFLEAASLDVHHSFDQRLRHFMTKSPDSHTTKPEVVGQIMTRKVRVTRPHRTLSDLVLLFNSTGHRHIPVVSEDGKLVGMVTQSDVVAALKVVDHIDAVPEAEAASPA